LNYVYPILASAVLAVLLATANVLLKMVSAVETDTGIEMYIASPMKILFSISLYFGVFLLYPYVLRLYPMSIVFPVYLGLTIMLIMLSGVVLFDEKIALSQIAGSVLLVIGIALISVPPS
jgi:multidrug transporter EmrE-like cation transporter